jgi:hypothetical protein
MESNGKTPSGQGATHILDRGGKRSATPLSCGRRFSKVRLRPARAKVVSPLRFATAIQNLR